MQSKGLNIGKIAPPQSSCHPCPLWELPLRINALRTFRFPKHIKKTGCFARYQSAYRAAGRIWNYWPTRKKQVQSASLTSCKEYVNMKERQDQRIQKNPNQDKWIRNNKHNNNENNLSRLSFTSWTTCPTWFLSSQFLGVHQNQFLRKSLINSASTWILLHFINNIYWPGPAIVRSLFCFLRQNSKK